MPEKPARAASRASVCTWRSGAADVIRSTCKGPSKVFSSGNEHGVNRGSLVAFSRHHTHKILQAVQIGDAAREVRERKPPGGEEIEGGPVGGCVDAEGAEDPKLLVHDEVGLEAGNTVATAGAGHHHRAAGAGQRQSLGK